MQTKDSTTQMRPPARPGRGGNRLRNLAAVCLTAFAIGFVGYFSYVTYQLTRAETPGQSTPNDISVFWAAARIALDGPPADAFDLAKLEAARNLPAWVPESGRRMAWSYPPQFHALILPLGLMSFNLAWVVFALAGVAAFWIGLGRLVPGTVIPIIAVASPAVLMCAIQGQSSLLVAALLAGFLACLGRGRQVLAGVLLGLLTIKPQFGPLLPLVLIACGAWRVIGWAVVTSLVILVLTLAWAGPGYWVAFFEGISDSADRLEAGWLPRYLMINWYAFGIATGLANGPAHALQLGVTAAIAAAVFWAWRRPQAPFALKAAVLTLAIPLASPYAYFYDLVLPMIGVALMLGLRRPRDYLGAATLAMLWASPTLGHFGREFGIDQAFALLTPPILSAALLLLLWKIAAARQPALAPPPARPPA